MLPSFRQIQADRDLARKRREERQRRQRAKAKRKSLLEKLEDRRLLAALTVTNENDSGEGSLRAAIETANSNNEADTITFAASVPSVALTADTIRLKRDFGQGRTYKTVIEGPGKIIVGDSQLLVEQYADVEFRNLDVTGATNIAVRNFGTTHITRSTFYNNGTAIQQSDGTTYVTLSTISGNTERGIGATDGDLVITDTTVTANPIGIGASASYFRMYNTIVAGNTFDSDISSDSFRAFHNLIGDANHASGITNGVNGNIVGVNGTGKRDINTILDTNLKLNGGHTQTHALVVGSPALDAASIGYSHQTVDQRGEKRIHGASMDIGAYEATIAEQLHNSVDVDGLRFISSGQFQQNTQSGTTTRVSTGSIEVGLKPSLDGLFTPLLRLPSGAVITTNASGKSFLSTGGLVAAVVKDKQANLMLGRLQNENESVLIPVADLTSSNGYSIPRDHRLDVDSGEKSFSPSRVKLAHSVKVGVVVIPEHVQMSGFLQFNALDGAGVFLSGTNHFRTSENGATAVINTGSLELRDAYHQTPSRTNPISMEIAGVSLQFATATMEYDKPTQEFKLGGTALATFEGGNADIVFGSGNDPNSFIVIKDDKIQGARTTVAVAEQFTVAGLRFRRPRPSQSIAVTLNASTNTIEFNGTAIASASDDTATPSTDTASQISGEEKNALDESPGPKVENLQFSRSVAAKLVNGVMQTFDTPVEPFSIGRLGVSNAASATPDQVMQLRYYGSKRGYTIYGSNQVITQDYGIDRDGRALAETKLNVGLHAVVIPDARARRNTRVVRGDDITIKNGRFDRFRIPIRSMSLLDKVTFFSDQYLHPVNEKAHEFFADYNPASQELRIVGKARLDGKEVTAPKVDFGTLGDSGYKSETALNGNLSPYESSNATKGTIAYRIEQIIKRSPFSQFRFYNSDHRAELNFPEVNNYTLARSGALTVTHSGGGIWDEPGPPGFRFHRMSVRAAGSEFIPHFLGEGYFEIVGTKFTATEWKLTPRQEDWKLEPVQPSGSTALITIDKQQIAVKADSTFPEVDAGFRPGGITFSDSKTRAKISLVDGFAVAGVQIEGGGTLSFATERNDFPVPGYEYKSDGAVAITVGDATFIANVTLDLELLYDGSLRTVGGTLDFVKQTGGSVGTVHNVLFSEMTATFNHSRFDVTGKGTYTPTGQDVTIGARGQSNGQLIFTNGRAELTNFIVPPQTYEIAGVRFATNDLERTGSFLTGSRTVTFTGSITLDVAGSQVTLTLGGGGTSGLQIQQTADGKFRVLKVGGTLSGVFTVAGVRISATGTMDYDVTNKELRIGGNADVAFAVAGQDITVGVTINALIRKGSLRSISASVRTDKVFTVFGGLKISLGSAGFAYNRDKETFGIHGSVKVSTPKQSGVQIIKNLSIQLGTPKRPGFVIKKGKLETIDVAIDTTGGGINLFGATVKANKLRLKYTRSRNELALTGGLDVTFSIGKKINVTARAAFPGKGLLINTRTGKVQIRGLVLSVAANKLPKIGPVGIKELSFRYTEDDRGNVTIGGSGKVELPGSLIVDASFEVLNGRLNKIRVSVSKANPGVAIGNTGVFLNRVEGGIEGLADPDNLKVDLSVTGTLGGRINIFGHNASLVKVTGKLTFIKNSSETSLTLDGAVSIAEGWIGRAKGTVKIYFDTQTNKFINIDANMYLFPGDILRGNLTFRMDRNFNIDATANLAVYTPRGTPLIGSRSLGQFEAHLHIRPSNAPRYSYGSVTATVDLSILEGSAYLKVGFDGRIKGRVKGSIGIPRKCVGSGFFEICTPSFQISKSKSINLRVPGARDLDFEIPDLLNIVDVHEIDVPGAELTIDGVTMDAGGPGGTVSFTGSSSLPEQTFIDLYVDRDGDGYDGELIATGLPFVPGQQTYHWSDIAAYASVPYDPNEDLYIYGLIHDQNNFAGRSNYSAPITPPNMNPAIQLPAEQSFETNQSIVFSTSQQNAISFTDPLAAHDPNAQLVATLDVFGGSLTLDPDQATPWTNTETPTDVDGNTETDVRDALHLISLLNDPALQAVDGQLPSLGSSGTAVMYDVDGDGKVTSGDVVSLTGEVLNTESDEPVDDPADEAPLVDDLEPDPNTVVVEGNETSRLVLIGTAAELNALLDGLTYTPYENSFFDDSLEVTVNRFPVFSPEPITQAIPLTAKALTMAAGDRAGFLPATYEQGSGVVELLDNYRSPAPCPGTFSRHRSRLRASTRTTMCCTFPTLTRPRWALTHGLMAKPVPCI